MSKPPPWPSLGRALRRLQMVVLTVAVAGAAGWAVVTGAGWIADRAEAAGDVAGAERVAVSVRPLRYETGFTVTRRYLGAVAPAQDSLLSFELAGLLDAIAVDEGETVAAGDLLARLDTALLETERAQLAAARKALDAQLTFAVAQVGRRAALQDRGFTAAEALDAAVAERDRLAAQIAETDAALASVEVRLEKSVLRAPFAGRVGERRADRGTTLAAGAPVLELLETSAPEVRVGLPLAAVPPVGTRAEIEIAGAHHVAELVRLRPDVDPATRTRLAIFALEDAPETVFGATAVLALPRQVDVRGAWVPMAALREGLQGTWTVLVVDEADTVRAAAVEILHVEADRAYVDGSFQTGARVVMAGPHRVTPGQRVRTLGES